MMCSPPSPSPQVTPDNAVQYEALIAGIGQRQVWGVAADEVSRALELVGGPPAAVLGLVLDMLLPDEAGRQAAAAMEQCIIVRLAAAGGWGCGWGWGWGIRCLDVGLVQRAALTVLPCTAVLQGADTAAAAAAAATTCHV
jgi:hypothetical protein